MNELRRELITIDVFSEKLRDHVIQRVFAQRTKSGAYNMVGHAVGTLYIVCPHREQGIARDWQLGSLNEHVLRIVPNENVIVVNKVE